MSDNLRDALVVKIKCLYHAERQLLKALPRMAKRASSEDLRDALESHSEETEIHLGRLQRIFKLLEERARGQQCAGMAGIIAEGQSMGEEGFRGAVLDACIIAWSQHAEHYEIAAYGTGVAWAEAMELSDMADLLRQTLEEEKGAADQLAALADDVDGEAVRDEEDDNEEDKDNGEDEEGDAAPEPGASRAASARSARSPRQRPSIRRKSS